ncbi:MarR family transcriptional regulator [Saccharopolyspora oryzae]|uniref:MarR family transcriptional regulator n=1 Tax=Saccharopolyspora oryzae TaxID=2997343 RepID=A0ABT4VAQ5_9PSEU|nr:MarR family transcriptional regulator [Saccharopolyspora oryzae]MDA3631050.1 MarR family transcriptional regulator [Saccharopolyspora oryzae]
MDPVEEVLAQWGEQRPDLDASPIAIFGRVRRIADLASGSLRGYLKSFGLNPGSFDILCNLRRGGKPYRKTPSELAASALVTSGAMTGRLDALEADGLIRRRQHPTDRRVSYAELTPAGRKLIDRVLSGHLDREELLLAHLGQDDRETIERALALLEGSVREAIETK